MGDRDAQYPLTWRPKSTPFYITPDKNYVFEGLCDIYIYAYITPFQPPLYIGMYKEFSKAPALPMRPTFGVCWVNVGHLYTPTHVPWKGRLPGQSQVEERSPSMDNSLRSGGHRPSSFGASPPASGVARLSSRAVPRTASPRHLGGDLAVKVRAPRRENQQTNKQTNIHISIECIYSYNISCQFDLVLGIVQV